MSKVDTVEVIRNGTTMIVNATDVKDSDKVAGKEEPAPKKKVSKKKSKKKSKVAE